MINSQYKIQLDEVKKMIETVPVIKESLTNK